MKKIAFFLTTLLISTFYNFAQTGNLLSNGDFKSLKSWTTNENLRKNGKVTLLPQDSGVMIYNPIIDLDGSLSQKIAASGNEWLSFSAKIKVGKVFSCATIAFAAFDKSGNQLATFAPFSDRNKIGGTSWKTYTGNIHLPANTSDVRIILTVLDGECSFANVTVNKYAGQNQAEGPPQVQARTSIIAGKGFSVDAYAVDRPFWELFSDDLDGDGKPEIVGCDVDGIVTVRNQGYPAFLTYAAGALVYQFEAADLNNDGIKEILLSSVDPKIPVKAIDLSGNVVRVFDQSKGHERLAVADMDSDGNTEVAISKRNLIQGSGSANLPCT